jgi:DoxX-like family
MGSNDQPLSSTHPWAGRIMSGLPALFLLIDGIMKLFKPPVVVQATVELGYPESVIVWIGVTLLACTVLYLIPHTSVLGLSGRCRCNARPCGRSCL